MLSIRIALLCMDPRAGQAPRRGQPDGMSNKSQNKKLLLLTQPKANLRLGRGPKLDLKTKLWIPGHHIS